MRKEIITPKGNKIRISEDKLGLMISLNGEVIENGS